MVLTPSSMLPLGTKAPHFSLPNTIDQKEVSLDQIEVQQGLVVMFICNHCPYVLHIIDELVAITKKYQDKGIQFVAISANDVDSHPADAPDKMAELAKHKQFTFPYLYDESQEVPKAYHAECTPDFFIFDKNLACVYRGRFDESTPGNNVETTGKDLINALDALITGKEIDPEQQPSIGCNIKWKK